MIISYLIFVQLFLSSFAVSNHSHYLVTVEFLYCPKNHLKQRGKSITMVETQKYDWSKKKVYLLGELSTIQIAGDFRYFFE